MAAIAWVTAELERPCIGYSIRNWGTLTGLPTERLRKFMRKARMVPSAQRGSRSQHFVLVDDFRMNWPALWRAIHTRNRDIQAAANDDDEVA